jgi:hypothetical protein
VGSRLLDWLVLVPSQPGQLGQRAFPVLPAEDEGETESDRNLPDSGRIPNLDQTELVVEQLGQSIQLHLSPLSRCL